MTFSDDFIARVRDATNIVDIINPYSELKRSGSNLMGRCPFPDHREKTASFSVSEDKQVYHCFGCKKGGNVFRFLEHMRGMNFPEAIEFLADRAGIPVPQEARAANSTPDRDQKKLFYQINRLAGLFYRKNLEALADDHPVRDYLRKRNLKAETIEEFKLGLAPSTWSSLADFLKSKGVPMDVADRLGLVRRRTGEGTGHFDLFRDRLMFPIISATEEVVGFGGRVMGEGSPKYLNSPETPVFHKGSTFYGLYQSAKFIRSLDEVIVVEGYMDFLGLYQAGIKNVVATLGTALTVEHARILQRLTKNVVVLFDSDQAGQQAAERSLPILLEAGLYPRGLTLPGAKDPDEAVAELGADAVRGLIAKSRDLFLVQLDRLFQGYRAQPSEKVQLMETLGPILLKVKDLSLRQLYLEQLAERLQVDDKWLRMSLSETQKRLEGATRKTEATPPIGASEGQKPSGLSSPQSGGSIPGTPPTKVILQKATKEESLLLNLVLTREEFLQRFLGAHSIQYLGQSNLREIFEMIEKLYRQDSSNFARLSSLLSDKIQDPGLVTEHLREDFLSQVQSEGEKLFTDCLNRLKARQLKEQARQLVGVLKSDQTPEALEQFMNIQRERLTLKNP